MIPTTLLLITTLTIPQNVLVLRTGQQIEISSAQENGDRILFRTPDGALYSLAASEVDLTATRPAAAREEVEAASPRTPKKLKATEAERKRLIDELEQNHSGQPVPPAKVEPLPPPPSLEQVAAQTEDEWNWRSRAREMREAVTRARENRDLLATKAAALRSHIAGLISLGYKPGQFSYDTTMLQLTVEEIPYADLSVTRAERALADFREQARQRGIPPGWVR